MTKNLGNWERPCNSCGITPQEGGVFHSAKVRTEGGVRRRAKCRSCERSVRRGQYVRRDSRTIKGRNVKRSFGISLEEYERRFHKQGSSCAICSTNLDLNGPQRASKAQLDHSHVTGRLREFLCPRCNVMLGMAQDDPETLQAAARYLEKHDGR